MEAIADDNKLTPTSPVGSIQVAGFDFMEDLSKKGFLVVGGQSIAVVSVVEVLLL